MCADIKPRDWMFGWCMKTTWTISARSSGYPIHWNSRREVNSGSAVRNIPGSKVDGVPNHDDERNSRATRSKVSPSSYDQCSLSLLTFLAKFGSSLILSKKSRALFRCSWSSPRWRSMVEKMWRWAISRWNAETKSQVLR